jgi:integrase
MLDESDNVRQGFVNPAEFVKLHDNLPGYLKPIIEFLYLTGMRSGAAKKLEHKHIDLEAQVIRLPIELSKNKKGLTIPLSGRLLLLVESAWNNRSISVLFYSTITVNPLETSGRHLTPLARLLAFKELYPMIFVDPLFVISFELVSKSLLL